MAEKTVIFNIQFDYRSYEGSGSSNRPRQMRQAFEQRGFEVIEISGVLSHRAIQVAELIPRLGDLGKAMLYAESSTAPHRSTNPRGGRQPLLTSNWRRRVRKLEYPRRYSIETCTGVS